MGTELCIILIASHIIKFLTICELFLVTPSQPNISIVTASKNGQGI